MDINKTTIIKPYPQEQMLIDFIPKIKIKKGERILCTSLGRAQFAHAFAQQHPTSHVYCHYFDLYRAQLAWKFIANPPANLSIECAADFPKEKFDIVALPTSYIGEAELTREMMQTGHTLLQLGGQMIITTDNKKDVWLGSEMKKIFQKINRILDKRGVLYWATKTKSLKKLKCFSCEFAFKDRNNGRLIRAYSRPSVFSHRHVDLGARRLMEAMKIYNGYRVLDIGCGWGALALAAFFRAPDVFVFAIDSNARAIQCTKQSAQLNNVANIFTKLTANGEHNFPGTYDLVLANPPYYANFQIAELFATTGQKALKPGGKIMFVTKAPHWYEKNMNRWFINSEIKKSKDYWIVTGDKKC